MAKLYGVYFSRAKCNIRGVGKVRFGEILFFIFAFFFGLAFVLKNSLGAMIIFVILIFIVLILDGDSE